jgi:hypothetical protein
VADTVTAASGEATPPEPTLYVRSMARADRLDRRR